MLYRATITNREVALDKVGFHQNTVGKDKLRLMLDEEWNGAEFVIVSFYRGRVSRATAEICGQRLWTGEDVDVPAAALTEAGDLRLTVTGVWPDGSQIVTCEMEEGAEVCWSGADSVDYEVDPGKDAISLLADMVQTANAAAVAAKEAAQSAEAIADAGYLPADGAEGQWLRKTAGDSEWADLPVPTAAEVGADPAGSAEAAKAEAMEAVGALSERVNLIANSDDETLDQLAEFAAFVKENRNLIENLDPLPQGGADGQVLTLVGGEAAWSDSKGGADTWHTASVSLTDEGLAFVGDVPSPHNDGGDALTLTVDVSGAWAEAAEAGALSMRFGDGSEAPVVDGSCYVPRNAMAVAGGELSVQAVAFSGQEAAEGEVLFTRSDAADSTWYAVGNGACWDGSGINLDTLRVGDACEVKFNDQVFKGTVQQVSDTRAVIGNVDCGVSDIPAAGTIPYHVNFDVDSNGALSNPFVVISTEVLGTPSSFTVSTAGTPGESTSNALAVPLLPGEPGMFTVVEMVEGEVFHTGPVEYISNKAMVGTEFGPSAQLVEGEEYILTIDDIERQGTAAVFTKDGITACYVGNMSLYGQGPDNGLDYLMITFEMSEIFTGAAMLNFDRPDLDGATLTVSTAPTATAKRLADAFEEIVERTTVEVAGEVLFEHSFNNIDYKEVHAAFVEGVAYAVSFDDTRRVEVAKKVTRTVSEGGYTASITLVGVGNIEATFDAMMGTTPADGTQGCLTYYADEAPDNVMFVAANYTGSTSTVTVAPVTSTPVTEAVTSLSTRVDALEGAGGGGAGADWNAAEGEPGHVLNRTHYIDVNKLVPETSFVAEATEGAGGSVVYAAVLDVLKSPIGATSATVTFDGIEYVFTSMAYTGVPIEFNAGESVLVGNMAMMMPQMAGTPYDTGEPFLVAINLDPNSVCTCSVAVSNVEKHTIEVRVAVYEQLDTRFVPSDVMKYKYLTSKQEYTVDSTDGLDSFTRSDLTYYNISSVTEPYAHIDSVTYTTADGIEHVATVSRGAGGTSTAFNQAAVYCYSSGSYNVMGGTVAVPSPGLYVARSDDNPANSVVSVTVNVKITDIPMVNGIAMMGEDGLEYLVYVNDSGTLVASQMAR